MTKVFDSAIMTALPFHTTTPPGWRAAPTFSLQLLTADFSLSCYFGFPSRQTWAVLWRARGPRPCPRARGRSSRRRRSTASPGLRSPGSETGARSPPAAACESPFTSASVRPASFGRARTADCRQFVSSHIAPEPYGRFMSRFWCRARVHQRSAAQP